MPNWCNNYATFSHADPAKIAKLLEAAQNNELFGTFVPLSSGEWDYMTAVNEWGTKWEASILDAYQNNDIAEMSFDTAWSPPVAFYDALTKLGFNVDATYIEEGMCFAGHYTSTDGDYSVDYDFSDEEWRLDVDDEVVVDLLENAYENYLMWMQEEEGEE